MSIANEALMSLIRSRLAADSRLSALAIDVCCTEGFVSLVGQVERPDQKALAVELISGLIGVRGVKDELQVRSSQVSSQSSVLSGQQSALSR